MEYKQVYETNIDGTKNCLVCRLPYDPTFRNQKYCSVRCRYTANNYFNKQNLHNKPIIKYQPPPPVFEKTCPQCERIYHTKQKRRAFCSRSCRNTWLETNESYKTWQDKKKRMTMTLYCYNCHREFNPKDDWQVDLKVSWPRRYAHVAMYPMPCCSDRCLRILRKQFRLGVNHGLDCTPPGPMKSGDDMIDVLLGRKRKRLEEKFGRVDQHPSPFGQNQKEMAA